MISQQSGLLHILYIYSEREYFLPQISREDEDFSEEEPEEDEDDIDNILEDEFPKDEEVMSEEDEEQEIDALERLRGELGEKFEADMNNLQVIQVITFPSFSIIQNVTFENETNATWFMPWFLFNVSKEMCILGLSSLLLAPPALFHENK